MSNYIEGVEIIAQHMVDNCREVKDVMLYGDEHWRYVPYGNHTKTLAIIYDVPEHQVYVDIECVVKSIVQQKRVVKSIVQQKLDDGLIDV